MIQLITQPWLLTVLRAATGDCTNGGMSSKHAQVSVIAVTDDERALRSFGPRVRALQAKGTDHLDEPAKGAADTEIGILNRLTNHDTLIGGSGLVLVHRECGDCLVPVSLILAGKWWMKGGNYAGSCDSRWRDQVSELPLPIFDRTEG